jgi:pimeloyl-ACP methyl ester carboxylesterase
MPDLRNHGESHAESPPHTVAACARDLVELTERIALPVEAAIGHSFGGKVALAWGEAVEAAGGAVRAVWALDTPPGLPELALAASSEVVALVGALRGLPQPFPRRDSVVTLLAERGFSPMLGQWMTTNVRPGPEGFVWRFDLDGVEAMLRSYAATDAWPWIEDPRRRAAVHLVRGGRSERWTGETLARAARARVPVHLLPDAGHWVHVDDPDGLHQLLLGAVDG